MTSAVVLKRPGDDLSREPLLVVRDIQKRFGGVQALDGADLTLLPGEAHALLGANGAGKSTLVKILGGVLAPDSGVIRVGGLTVRLQGAAQALACGIGVIFQEPAMPRSLSLGQALNVFGVTGSVRDAFDHCRQQLGLSSVAAHDRIAELTPSAVRLLDLARVLAHSPRILILDELTAELPADESERVFQQLDAYRVQGGSIIYVSHRLGEVRTVCSRVTVLRDGHSVATVELAQASDADLMALMLGEEGELASVTPPTLSAATGAPVLEVLDLADRRRLRGVSLAVRPGEILGIAALEDQGARELLECIAGVQQAAHGQILVGGHPVQRWSVARAVAAGLAYVPAERGRALLPQRSVPANVSLALEGAMRRWLLPLRADEHARTAEASRRMAIDMRSGGEVRQLSGGNQQKVVVARWLARDLRVLVAFDPTRGIDVITKRELYDVFRELAAQGVAIVLYSSELPELLQVTHRVMVVYEGRVHTTIATKQASEAGLLGALYGLGDGSEPPTTASTPVAIPTSAASSPQPSPLPTLTALPTVESAGGPAAVAVAPTALRTALVALRPSWRSAQVVGVYIALLATLALTYLANHQALTPFGIQTLMETAVPLAFAAMAQMCVVLVRGIDLSVGSQIAVINVTAAVVMHRDPTHGLLVAVGLLMVGATIGGLTGLLVTVTHIPDIIATLATSSLLGGIALFILPTPGGSIPSPFAEALSGTVLDIPTVLILMVGVAVVVWWPLRRSVRGLRIYATGGDPDAARLAGLSIGASRILAYTMGGVLCAIAGLILSAQTQGGDPSVGSPYTLNSIAVAMIAGVALTGGAGTAIGVIGASLFLTELISMLFFYGVNPNFQTLLQGAVLIAVMAAPGLSRLRGQLELSRLRRR